MAIKRKLKSVDESVEELLDEDTTPAAQTLDTHNTVSSKASMMANVMSAMSQMPNKDCCDWFEQAMSMANSKYLSKDIPDDAAAKNAASIAAKTVKEEVDNLFTDSELSEDFKQKTAVLFEAAVNAKVLIEKEQLEEAYQEQLEEEVAEITEGLVEQVDQYLSYVAEQWMEENEVAVESALKSQLSEQFMSGLRDLFAEHYITFPEESVDAVEALSERVEELESQLSDALNENIELRELEEQLARSEIFDEVTDGMVMTQVDKLEKLSEGIDFEDAETFKKKLEVLKEHHFKIKPTQSFLNEEVDVDGDESDKDIIVDPQIRKYSDAISRTLKR